MANPLPFQDPRRAFLTLFAFVSVAYFAIFIFSAWSLQERLLKRASHSNDITARNVLTALQTHLASDPIAEHRQSPELRSRLDSVIKRTTYGLGIRRVRIFSLEGDLIYSSDDTNADSSPVDDISKVIDSLRGSSSMLLKSEEGANVLEYFAPLRDQQGEVNGVCELYFDISSIVSSSETAAKRILVAGTFAFFIVALALCWYFLRLLSRFELERKQQEESSRKAKELEELATTGMFISGLAHQLRNPISILKGVGSALTRRMTDEQQPFILALDEEVLRMEALIESFLRFAQPRLGEPTDGAANLKQQVEHAAQVIEQLHPHVTIERTVDPQLLAAVNSDLLRESLINVLSNSVDALDGEPTPMITVRGAADGSEVLLSVQDNGPGFSNEIAADQQLAFRPFYTTKSKGSGLGLALVKKIVEAAAGSVTIANAVPHGAIITLRFPKHTQANEAAI